jgi:cell division septum initiation protein DivIVA
LKSSILKIAVPTLVLGLAFAPMASAAPKDTTTTKTEVTVKVDSKTKVTKTDAKAKVVAKKLTAKEKEAIKKLASITKNISKVEASVKQLTTATTNFYAKAATTTEAVKVETNFFTSAAGKLKANTNQLKALKKQVDQVAKKYKGTDVVTATYKKIADLNIAISTTTKNLTDLHTKFQSAVKVEESKKQLTSITENISKVEASVVQLSKVTADFYAKAATDSSVTAQVEADFYTKTSDVLQANTKQLVVLKEQLDSYVKNYGTSDAVTAEYAKITAQNVAVTLAVETLTKLHTNFKPVPVPAPVPPTPTNP